MKLPVATAPRADLDAWRDVVICGKCWHAVSGFDLICSTDRAAIRRRKRRRARQGQRRRT